MEVTSPEPEVTWRSRDLGWKTADQLGKKDRGLRGGEKPLTVGKKDRRLRGGENR